MNGQANEIFLCDTYFVTCDSFGVRTHNTFVVMQHERIKRRDIEGLRAIAVGLVLLYHAGFSWMKGGYVGVDVFFVISGFLITSLLVREREDNGRISLSNFYSRRARRILPMSAVVVLFTLVASLQWLEPLRRQSLGVDAIGTATFSSNLIFADRGADYLQASLPPSPLQHYWSLAVEEQFYLVWPALIILVTLGVRHVRLRVGVLSALVAVSSFVACMMLMDSSPAWAFFSPHTRAFELALGALLAVVPLTKHRVLRVSEIVLSWGGVVAVVAIAVLFSGTTRFPGPWALLPVVATAFVIRGGDAHWGPRWLLRAPPMQWLGARSYSAYLWHWPVLILAEAAKGERLTLSQASACIAISLALSELSFRFIENPIHINKKIVGLRAVALTASLIVVVVGSGLLMRNNPPVLASSDIIETPTLDTTTTTVEQTPVDVATTLPPEPTAPTLPPVTRAITPVVESLAIERVPQNLTPTLNKVYADEPEIYKNNCHVNFGTTQPKDCVYGNPESSKVVGLYGDSHAAQWFPALKMAAEENDWKLIIYTKRGCPPANILTYSSVLGQTYTQCGEWRKNVKKKMKADGVKVVLVVHFDRLLSASNQLPIWQKDWREGLQTTIDDIRRLGAEPVLFADTPYPGRDVPTCLSSNINRVPNCALPVNRSFREDIVEVRADLSRVNNVPLLQIQDWFCTKNVCPPIVGNILVYRDDNHITTTYAEFLAPLMGSTLAPVVDWFSGTSNS
jgi:peptidoglycan/LPS O-acetylase OafA/YrhL